MWLTSMGRLKNAHVFPVYLVSTTVPVFDHHGSDWHWRCGPRLTPEPSGQKPPMPSTYLIHSMSQRHWELKMDLHVDTVGLIKKNDYHHSDFTPSSGYHPGTYGQIYPEPSWRCLNSIEPQPWNIAGVPCRSCSGTPIFFSENPYNVGKAIYHKPSPESTLLCVPKNHQKKKRWCLTLIYWSIPNTMDFNTKMACIYY